MNKNIKNHPTFNFVNDINEICNPLKKFNITYFAHVVIDKNRNFSAIGNNPEFGEIYLNNEYYNADIHLADSKNLGKFVMWDALDLKGKSREMHELANQHGVKHTFTIIDNKEGNKQFFHFASNTDEKSINQVYLANLDLLNQFIDYFQTNVCQSKKLSYAYDLKFGIGKDSDGYLLQTDYLFHEVEAKRKNFITMTTKSHADEANSHRVIFHKDTAKPVLLAPQQLKCFQLLIAGNSAKAIAAKLNISHRTVNHYLLRIRRMLGCRTSKEMISRYQSDKIIF